jgi:hypothetical protein
VQVLYIVAKKGGNGKVCYIPQNTVHGTRDIYILPDPKPRRKEDTKEREEVRIMPEKTRSDTLTVNGRKTMAKRMM